jgi:Ca2+-transporting ATPase
MACGNDINSLFYAGMVGIHDPPRPGCRESIELIQAAGVSIKMITGDAFETAYSIAKKLNIYAGGDSCLSGTQLDQLTDIQLEGLIRGVTVFYRTSPKHKLRIVKALQSIGEVVAMTGDGVNDAVALKKADIGVAMGESGTDVCKEACLFLAY